MAEVEVEEREWGRRKFWMVWVNGIGKEFRTKRKAEEYARKLKRGEGGEHGEEQTV